MITLGKFKEAAEVLKDTVRRTDLILAEKAYVLSQNELLDYEKARQTALTTLAVLIGDSPNNINEYKRICFSL